MYSTYNWERGYCPGDVYNGPVGRRMPGEGSPRQSGDDASSLLRQTRSGGPSFPQTSAARAAMSQLPTELGVSHAVPRIPPPTTKSDSSAFSGTQSSYSHASGFSVVIDRPNQGLGQLPTEQLQAHGLSAADLHRPDQERMLFPTIQICMKTESTLVLTPMLLILYWLLHVLLILTFPLSMLNFHLTCLIYRMPKY